MKEQLNIKEAKNLFIKRCFYCSILSLLVCWVIKLCGVSYFNLDLENELFNDLDKLFNNHYWLRQLYYSITLYFQMYLLFCITHGEKGKKNYLYILCCLPIILLTRYFTSSGQMLYKYSLAIEFIITLLILSKLKIKNIPKSFLIICLNLIFQTISLSLRNLGFKGHNDLGFVAEQLLSIDYYILLYISKEVMSMDGGTFFFFGLTSWLYYVAGFIVGIFKLHPIKTARKWYAKGKEKENARKTKKELKKSKKQN